MSVNGFLIPSLSRRIAFACRKDGARAVVVRAIIEKHFEELALGVPQYPRDWKPDGRVRVTIEPVRARARRAK